MGLVLSGGGAPPPPIPPRVRLHICLFPFRSTAQTQNCLFPFTSSILLLLLAYGPTVLLSLPWLMKWVSHLGKRLAFTSPYLMAGGYPSLLPVDTVSELAAANLFNSIIFVLPHSALRVSKLNQILGTRHGRLVYNLIAAGSLHRFLCCFRPYNCPVLFELPIPEQLHNLLSLGCLVLAAVCFLSDQSTWGLLGMTPALYCIERAHLPPPGM
jgi:hypothetical protein